MIGHVTEVTFDNIEEVSEILWEVTVAIDDGMETNGSFKSAFKLGISLLGLDDNSPHGDVKQNANDVFEKLTHIEKSMRLLSYSKDASHMSKIDFITVGLDSIKKIRLIVNDVDTSFTFLSMFRGSAVGTGSAGTCPDIFDKLRGISMSNEKYQDSQLLTMYILFSLERDGYRRCMEGSVACVYSQIKIEGGYNSHAWKKVSTLEEYVHTKVGMSVNGAMFNIAAKSPGLITSTVGFLSKSVDFAAVEKNRRVFSFRNGIYITVLDEKGEQGYESKFYAHANGDSLKIDRNVVACKMFDADYVEDQIIDHNYLKFVKRHCPSIYKIMDNQEWSKDQMEWAVISTGRLLHPINQLDKWQIMPFHKGIANVGKSLWINGIAGGLFDQEDVAVVGNGIEQQFGLSAFKDMFLITGPEIKHDFKMAQTDFQGMVSGDKISISTKNQTAKGEVFTTPMIMAGNELPGFIDNSGSFSRRILLFLYTIKVTEIDCFLRDKIEKEIPAFVRVANECYLRKVNTSGSSGIDKILPKCFIDAQNNIKNDSNALASFLDSGKFTYGKDFYIRETEFQRLFGLYCSDNKFLSGRWIATYYEDIFSSKSVHIFTGRKKDEFEGKVVNTRWVCGLKPSVDEDETGEETSGEVMVSSEGDEDSDDELLSSSEE